MFLICLNSGSLGSSRGGQEAKKSTFPAGLNIFLVLRNYLLNLFLFRPSFLSTIYLSNYLPCWTPPTIGSLSSDLSTHDRWPCWQANSPVPWRKRLRNPSSWWRLSREIYTSFASLALLEDSVRHDECFVLVARDVDIAIRSVLTIDELALFAVVLECRPFCKLLAPFSWNTQGRVHLSLIPNPFPLISDTLPLPLAHLIKQHAYLLH